MSTDPALGALLSVDANRIRNNDVDASLKNRSQWKTNRLIPRIAVDALTALTAAMTVSPIMTLIDRAVIEAAAGHKSVIRSIEASMAVMVRHPHQFVVTRPFSLMLLLYGGTYLTANVADTMSSHAHELPASSTTSTWAKLGTVSTVNVGLSVYKDSQFARTFGRLSARPLPPASYGPFLLRDALTLFATFNLPQMIAPSLPISLDDVMSRMSIAQLITPAASQVFATPLHLLGLDLYNRNGKVPWRDRVRRIGDSFGPTTMARMCRVIPAYGLGGVVNTGLRTHLMDQIK